MPKPLLWPKLLTQLSRDYSANPSPKGRAKIQGKQFYPAVLKPVLNRSCLIQDEEEEEEDETPYLGKSTTSMVERGIRRMLEGADIDGVDSQVREEFSTEVRSYIASHFRYDKHRKAH